MVCFYCGNDTKVINSRPNKRSRETWRRRQCRNCGRTWSTYEASDYTTVFTVKGHTGQLQPFSRDKLFLSIYNSCQHRPQAVDDATALTTTAIAALPRLHQDGWIATAALAAEVSQVLERFDTAAAVHYRAFHKL